MRLNRYLSQAGIASRRKADELIAAGRVTVNGKPTTDFSTDVTDADRITVNGRAVKANNAYTYVAMNKPAGYVSTTADWFSDEESVMELIPKYFPKSLKPVGRLDKDSTGLLLFTDDGQLAYELTHPSFEHEKEYVVTCHRAVTDDMLEKMATGVRLEEGITKPATVQRINDKQFRIILEQGWKRQIRRMAGAVGADVAGLHRVRVGKLHIDTLQLAPGDVKGIRKEDVVS